MLFNDFRLALRWLIRNRGTALLAVLSLALGIGANTTIFSLINAVFLRPLPVADPATLVSIYTRDVNTPGYLNTSFPNLRDLRRENSTVTALTIYCSIAASLTGEGDPRLVNVQLVSGDYFAVLGVKTTVGRSFSAEEDSAPGGHPVAVISSGLWRRAFGADGRIEGRVIHLNNGAFTVIGVAPAGFNGMNAMAPADVWVPTMMYTQIMPEPSWFDNRRMLVASAIGRLKPGVTRAQAQTALQAAALQLEQQYPRENRGRSVTLLPLAESYINPRFRGQLTTAGWVLMGVAALVLLVACANVANLLLARAAARSREIAIRSALGAGRRQIMRQLLAESLLLGLLGGACGLLLARWLRDLLWAARPEALASADLRVELDGRVLAFTLAVSVVTGVLFGLVPALRASRPDLVSDLKDRAGQAPVGSARPLLVMVQVALSVVTLIGSSLFLRSLQEAQRIDPGFRPHGLVLVQFNLASRGYDAARGREFERQVVERVAHIPGVTAASLGTLAPFTGGFSRTVLVEGQDEQNSDRGRVALLLTVTPGYLKTLGIPLQQGRDLSELDRPDTPGVAVVNDVVAARYWPGQPAIGKRFRFFGFPSPMEVVGVARTANYIALGEAPRPMVYVSALQTYTPLGVVHARVTGDSDAALATIRREMQRQDPNLLLDSSTMDAQLRSTLWAPRLAAGLLGGFGLLALILTVVGIYGVVSYSVHQRTREIGVRMALGATPADVQRMVVVEGIRLVAFGAAAGCLLALALARSVQSMLYVVRATDASTFIAVPGILALVALAACWIPSLRATRISPVEALRAE